MERTSTKQVSFSSDSPSCGFNGSNFGECLTLTSDLSWALARSRLRSCWGINLGGWCERQSTYGHQAPWIVKFHADSAQTCSNHCSRCFSDSLLFSCWRLSAPWGWTSWLNKANPMGWGPLSIRPPTQGTQALSVSNCFAAVPEQRWMWSSSARYVCFYLLYPYHHFPYKHNHS